MKRQDLFDRLEGLLGRIADRLDHVEANQAITNTTLRDLGQVQGIMSDQLRELHSRFIELSDDHRRKIRALEKRAGATNGRR